MSGIFYIFWYIQIILESVPISSSGHVVLAQYRAHVYYNTQIIRIPATVEHLMHVPTILVLIMFLVRHYSFSCMPPVPDLVTLGIMLTLANAVTVGIYLLFKYVKKAHECSSLWVGFLCTSCALMSLVFISQAQASGVYLCFTAIHALIIGLAQGIALLPGVSRLAITFVSARWLGYTAEQAFLFSCALQLQLILAAVVPALYTYSLAKFRQLIRGRILTLVLITGVSYSILELVFYAACTNTLWYLSWYMLVVVVYAFSNRKALKELFAFAC